MRRLAIALAATMIGTVLGACITESCTKPIGAGLAAHIELPRPAFNEPRAVGACAQWVVAGGRYYRDQRSEGWRFEIDPADLTAHGMASEASPLVGELASATIYLVDDLDPEHFLAMEAADGEYFIVVPDGTDATVDVDASLCRYAVESPSDVDCGAADADGGD